MKFRFVAREEPVCLSDNFWYCLGGYLKPGDVLADPAQLAKLQEAIDLVSDFETQAVEAGALEYL